MRKILKTRDGLVNMSSGLGTGKSKRSQNQWQYDLMNNWGELEACYQSNWIARAICDIPARDMVREWRTIKSDGAEKIAALEKQLNVPCIVEDAIRWSSLYGGAGVLLLTNQDLSKPLNLNTIKTGDLKRVLTFDRWDLVGVEMNTWDVLTENYLKPEYYILRGGSQRIHWSHVCRFYGERLPLRWQAVTLGWGDSVLRKCIEEISDMVAAKGGIAELMQECNIDVITRQDLAEDMATDQQDAIAERYALFSQMKSNINMALLDGDEKLERNTLALSGVAPVIEQFITWIAGAARMPVTKLFGTSAKGMNATGEGDLTNYYDEIRSRQRSDISGSMRRLDEVLVRSALGSWNDSFDYVWNPLSEEDREAMARTELVRAQRDTTYLEVGVITKSQIQRNLQADETYQFDEKKIEELEAMEENNLMDAPEQMQPDFEEVRLDV